MNDKQHWNDDETELMAKVPLSQTSNSSLDASSDNDKNAGYECARNVGARLARLREEKNWVLDDISAHLKVPVAKLRALETGELDQLPDPAFAVGLLRSYAKILGIDPAPFIEELHSINGLFKTELSVPGMRGGSLPRNHESVIWRGRWQKGRIWAISIALILIGLGFYLSSASLHWSTSLRAPSLVNEAKQAQTPVLVAPSEASLPTSAPAVINAAPTMAPLTVQTPASQPSQARPSSVHFKVSQDNWVSVRQQDGKEIYGGVLYKGEERTVQGMPPFKVIVGNQTGLESIELDGKRIAPSKYANPRQNNVVHFDLP